MLENGTGVTAAHVAGSIAESERWEQRFIDSHPHLLHGTLDDLRFNQPALYPPDGKTDAERERDEDVADAVIEDGAAPLIEQLAGNEASRRSVARVA